MDKHQTKQRHLGKSTLLAGITSFADIFLLLLLIAAGRLMGAEDFGSFTLALAGSSVLVFALNLGLDNLATRRIVIDRTQAPEIIGGVLAWKGALSFGMSLAAYTGVALVVGDPVLRELSFILLPACILRSFNMTLRHFLHGFERFGSETLVVTSERFLVFSCGLAVLLTNPEPQYLAWVFLAVRVMIFLCYLLLISKFVCRFRLYWDFAAFRQFQRTALPMGIATVCFGLYIHADILLLGLFLPNEMVGLFGAALKIYDGLWMLCAVFDTVFFPRLSQLHIHSPAEHRKLFLSLLRYLLICGVPVAVGGLLYADEMMLLLFASPFDQAAPALKWMLVAVALQYLLVLMFIALRAIGHSELVMAAWIIGLVTKVVLELILIPRYGIEAGAMGMLMASSAMLLFAWFQLRSRNYDFAGVFSALSRIILASGIAVAAVVITAPDWLAVSILVYGLVYLACILLLRILTADEVASLRMLLNSRSEKAPI